MITPRARAQAFCDRFGLRVPILQAPMAGSCPPALAIAVAGAGGMGGAGALMMDPAGIATWARTVRAATNGAFQLNLWIPDPPPLRDPAAEARMRDFLGHWGPIVPETAGDAVPADFAAQCEALLQAGPAVVSSIMGLYPAPFVAQLKQRGIAWFACVTTTVEAREAAAAGADALVVQGVEAGGHRGSFDPAAAERQSATLFALLPQIADQTDLPLIATGGIADGRGVAAALVLGASAVQIGTALLRSPEADIAPAWAAALAEAATRGTVQTRAFSGRLGRSLGTAYTLAPNAPPPEPYPVQRGLTTAMRAAAQQADDVERMQAWAGMGAAMARAAPAADIVQTLWEDAQRLLP
ncbi:nitronate monooxygenase [Acidisphaera sp. L21]|uniref:nitronate monooxygenase n=1 Tax=Acidisphaera sp. L21 TaxID=1641851 RepID=UPI00131EB85F|nr:nitronate monooxygenase [Acidisphaera sp. L21]